MHPTLLGLLLILWRGGIAVVLKSDVAPRCFSTEYLSLIESGHFHCDKDWLASPSSAALAHRCHSQGIGYWNSSFPTILTCQESKTSHAQILTFDSPPHASPDTAMAIQTLTTSVPPAGNHPSALQLHPYAFPIAIAQSHNVGPTRIEFYGFDSQTTKIHKIPTLVVSVPRHIGALGYAQFTESTIHMVGCGWNCATLTFWKAKVKGTIPDQFDMYMSARTVDLLDPKGLDTHVGGYNSLFLTSHCGTNEIMLMATHTVWLDIYKISNIGTQDVRLTKIRKRRVPWNLDHLLKPIFLEGVTMLDEWHLLANPHDFGRENCPYPHVRCVKTVYQCRFFPSHVSTW